MQATDDIKHMLMSLFLCQTSVFALVCPVKQFNNAAYTPKVCSVVGTMTRSKPYWPSGLRPPGNEPGTLPLGLVAFQNAMVYYRRPRRSASVVPRHCTASTSVDRANDDQ